MKRLILILSLLVSCQFASAQDEWAVFDFYAGPSFPLGKFGSNSIQDGGYAKTGFSLGVGPNWYFTKNWGIFFHLGYQSNQVDDKALVRDFMMMNPGYTSVTYEGGDYSSILAMIGPSFTLRFSDKFRWLIKIGAGLFTAFQSDVEANFDGIPVLLESDSKFTFSAYVGTGLTYFITDKVGIHVNADLTDANPEYNLRFGDINFTTENQRQTNFNVGLGVSLRIE